MNKYTRYIIITLLTPLVLFLVAALMLYLPPIQNFMVDKAAVIASEKTGLAISVNHVRLVFPCNLGVEGVEVLQQNDSGRNGVIATFTPTSATKRTIFTRFCI